MISGCLFGLVCLVCLVCCRFGYLFHGNYFLPAGIFVFFCTFMYVCVCFFFVVLCVALVLIRVRNPCTALAPSCFGVRQSFAKIVRGDSYHPVCFPIAVRVLAGGLFVD